MLTIREKVPELRLAGFMCLLVSIDAMRRPHFYFTLCQETPQWNKTNKIKGILRDTVVEDFFFPIPIKFIDNEKIFFHN